MEIHWIHNMSWEIVYKKVHSQAKKNFVNVTLLPIHLSKKVAFFCSQRGARESNIYISSE